MCSENFVSTIKHLQPSTTHEAGTHLRLHFRRDFGSFQQRRAQPQRMPEATRAYQQGDPLSAIDWRAYARTDQLLINQQRHTANASVIIAVSCLPAMQWPPASIHADATTKLETALRVALNLAFIHSKILDHVTLCLVADQLYLRRITSAAEVLDIYTNFCAVKFNFAQLLRVCTFVNDEASLSLASSLARLNADAKYWLGDGLQGNFQIFLNDASFSCLLHTLSAYEFKSDWLVNDSSYFEQPQEVLGKSLRRVFHPRLQQWLADIERGVTTRGGKYLLLTEDTELVRYFDFLNTNLRFVS